MALLSLEHLLPVPIHTVTKAAPAAILVACSALGATLVLLVLVARALLPLSFKLAGLSWSTGVLLAAWVRAGL